MARKLEKQGTRAKKEELRSRLTTAPGGRLKAKQQYSQSLALAMYMAMLADPSPENCCRAPEISTMRETFVFCLKQSGTVSADVGGRIQFTINQDPRCIMTTMQGTFTFGLNQPNSAGWREFTFTNYPDLLSLARIGRLNAIRYRLRPIMNAFDVKGFWADAPLPNDGSTMPSILTVAAVSTLPNSLCGNVVANAEISAFLLPAASAGKVTSTAGAVPMEFYDPFAWRYLEDPLVVTPVANNDSFGCRHIFACDGLPASTPSFQIEIEACYEVQPENQILLQVAATGSIRPPVGSGEAIDDVMTHIRPSVAGQVPLASSGPAGLGGAPQLATAGTVGPTSRVSPKQVVETMAAKAADGEDISSSSAGMVDDLMPTLENVASHAFDLATEYGPDLLTAVGGLLPGGADAGLALKYGGKALKWLTGK